MSARLSTTTISGHRFLWLRATGVAAAVLLSYGVPPARGAELPNNVRQALVKNTQAASPVRIHWTTTYASDHPVDEALQIGKFAEGANFFKPHYVQFDRQEIKYSYFKKCTRTSSTGPADFRFFNRYDGTDCYLGNFFDGKLEAVMVFSPEQQANTHSLVFEAEYFDRIGVQHYSTMSRLGTPDESRILYLIETDGFEVAGAEDAELSGKPCFRITLESDTFGRRHRFHLAPAMNYALLKHELLTLADAPVRVTVNSEFTEFPDPHAWLPKKSTTDWYWWRTMSPDDVQNERLVRETIEVSVLEKEELPNETFVMDVEKSGTIVADGRVPGAEKQKDGFVHYQVPANLDHLEGVIAAAAENTPFVPPDSNWLRKLLIGGNFVILILVGAVWWYRSRKRA